jgi:cobalt-zinc-cadmium efflux system protein
LAAIKIAQRPADARRTYGYHRFEILAAAFNALLLFVVAFYILFEAYQRFGNPPEVQSIGMLWIAVLGLSINLISMRLLSSSKEQSLNLKGAYLEVWSDMLGSVGVILGAGLIFFTGWVWIDTLVAVGIGFWVLPRTWELLKESLHILLEGVPDGIDINEVRDVMLSVPAVISVHELHIWALSSGKNSLAAHIVHSEETNPALLIKGIQEVLGQRFRIFHTTLQCETTPCEDSEEGCNFTGAREKSIIPPHSISIGINP